MSDQPVPRTTASSPEKRKNHAASPRKDPDPGRSGVLVALGGAPEYIDADMELINEWRAGSRKALEVLFQQNEQRIFAICLRMLGNPEQAADVAQDALLRIHQGLKSFDGRARFSTWSVRVTLNCVYSYLRREKLRRHAPLPDASEGRDPRSMEPLPHQGVEKASLRRDVLSALGGIDLDARAILVLRDLQGLDYADIAEVIGTPIGTVKSRLFRARAALRISLEQMGHRGYSRRG